MKRLLPAVLKLLAVTVALAFLGGAMVAAAHELFTAPPERGATKVDAGPAPQRVFFNATKSAPLPLPPSRVDDGGTAP